MNLRVFQKGFNYSQDGEGNRLVYHFQGCNMKCPWCANPEGMKYDGALLMEKEWLLDSVCPHNAVYKQQLNRDICAGCVTKECITKHKSKGIRLSYEEYLVEDIVREVLDCQAMYYDGGGVTFTGGEATLQYDGLREVLIQLKKQGIHTAIETNGSHLKLPELFPLIDQLIIDCKLCNAAKHIAVTGLSNAATLSNIRMASKVHPRLHIRIPVIGGVNDQSEDFEDFLVFLAEVQGSNVTAEILTYHEFGKEKWRQCGWLYQMTEDAYADPQKVRHFRDQMKGRGIAYLKT